MAAIGIGGTITGAGEVLLEAFPDWQVAGIAPAGSAVLSGAQPGPNKILAIRVGFVPGVLNVDLMERIGGRSHFVR